MDFKYETQHLILKLLEPSWEYASKTLEFYKNNRVLFERREAVRPLNFYTREYQKAVLSHEYHLALQKKYIRFWIFEKRQPEKLIGTISFYNILHSAFERCETGYKLDEAYWHKGYAREAMSFGVSLMFEELNLHRIEAYVMKDNSASIRLLKDLGFQFEGICRKSIRIRGNWEDHMLFARIKTDGTSNQNSPSYIPPSSPSENPESQTLSP